MKSGLGTRSVVGVVLVVVLAATMASIFTGNQLAGVNPQSEKTSVTGVPSVTLLARAPRQAEQGVSVGQGVGSPASPASTPIVTIPVGTAPVDLAYDSGKGEVFVANQGSYNVSVINGATNGVVVSVPVGNSPEGVAYDSGKGEVFVANYGSNNVSVISDVTNTVVTSIPVGSNPMGVAYDSGKGEVFVANEASNNVSVISGVTNTVVTSIRVGTAPWSLAYDNVNGEVFVANMGASTVSVISDVTNTVVTSIPVGNTPEGVAYDSGKGEVFVANQGSYNVSVINGATNGVVVSFPVRNRPAAVVYDSANGYLYVANELSNTVIAAPTMLTVTASAMGSSGPAWLNVNFNASPFAGSWNYTHWAWSFGDGNTSTLQDSTHTYTRPGSYQANVTVTDSTGTNATSNTVWINVTHPLPFTTTLTASKTAVSVGEPVWVNASMSGGVGPFSYVWNVTPAYAGCVTSATSPVATCIPTLPGKTFSLSVEVTDLYGATDNATSPTVSTGTPTVAITPSRIAVDVNESVTLATYVTSDLASLSYSYTSPKMAGCAPSTNASLTCTPTAVGAFSVSVMARDSYGNSWTATSVTIKVYPALLVSLTLSSTTPLLTQTIAFVVNASGGNPPYSYTYLGLPFGCYSENQSSIGCLPTQAEWYNITAVVKDLNNATVRATVTMHVIFDFNVVIPASTPVGKQLTIMVDTNETFNGTAINKTALFNPAGGYGTFTYNYSGLPPGCTSTDVAVLTCTPTQVGKYTVTVSVHDQAGDHNTHAVVVNVVPAKSTSAGISSLFSGATGYAIIGGLGAVVAILVAVFVIRSRRSKRGGAKGISPSSSAAEAAGKTDGTPKSPDATKGSPGPA